MIGLRRDWIVNYAIDGGAGRIFMTTKRLFLSEDLIKEMDEYLKQMDDLKNPFVQTAVPIGFSIAKEGQK